ncbi:DUF397 domain-containing protein [Streptomyces ruber]|uniref:DUF397 domain-containing protein n=2 Tax=Streptomyces TaxID=1883 RepID=A0A918B6L8_9ACTN|nr:DUF397 domain-containing protein [Streptomyces ruber]GGQ38546.1 DUF397 domain-containing protein [Streptomyces ruber]
MAIKQGATNVWIKSSYSQGNGACVEVSSPVSSQLAVRDSKLSDGGPILAFPADAWNLFVSSVKG